VQADKCRTGKASNWDCESATDPESRVMQHADGRTHLSYKVHASVDSDTGIIEFKPEPERAGLQRVDPLIECSPGCYT